MISLEITFVSALAFSQEVPSYTEYPTTDAQGENTTQVLNKFVTASFIWYLKFSLDFEKVKAWEKTYRISCEAGAISEELTLKNHAGHLLH